MCVIGGEQTGRSRQDYKHEQTSGCPKQAGAEWKGKKCLFSMKKPIIDGFNRYFINHAKKNKRYAKYFSLDGQDVIAGADYIITDKARLALIEFKYTDAEIRAEADKSRRSVMCDLLEVGGDMVRLHDQCHFIAWGERVAGQKLPTLEVKLNIYRHEVCNRSIFPKSPNLGAAVPNEKSRVKSKTFCEEFFCTNSSRSLSLNEFEIYVAWLLSSAGGSNRSSLELLVDDEDKNGCAMIEFPSVRAALEWTQIKRSSLRPKP